MLKFMFIWQSPITSHFLSLPLEKKQVLAGNRDYRNHAVAFMQHCKFCILPVSVWFTVMFRVLPREMPNPTEFEYHIANLCLHSQNTENYSLRPQRL